MKIEASNLDYYSNFLGEPEIRIYGNAKEIVFKKNMQEFTKNRFYEVQLRQGENGIFFFSLWDGYFDTLMKELVKRQDYMQLPGFIKNWVECKGWCDVESSLDVILKDELRWLNQVIPVINEEYKHDSKKKLWNYNCFNDLSRFLNFIEKNDWELRIAEE